MKTVADTLGVARSNLANQVVPARTRQRRGRRPKPDAALLAEIKAIIAELLKRGASVAAYDPVAIDEARRVFGDTPGLSFAASPMAAVTGADALLIVTEWKEFRSPDFDALRRHLRHPVIFDGRNLYEPDVVRSAGFEHFSIGRR